MIGLWLALALHAAAMEPPADPFAPVTTALASGKRGEAGELLVGLVNDPAAVAVHGQAWRAMAGVLTDLDLDSAALVAWHNALKVDAPNTGANLPAILELAKTLGDEDLLAPGAAPWLGVAPDANSRSRVGYLAARHQLRSDNLGAAAGLLPIVDKSSPDWADARALKGITASEQGQHQVAIDAFSEALTAGRAANRGERWLSNGQLNLARAYFAAGNFGQAMVHYSLVSREASAWPEAQFERAWAHFRAEDMAGSLALLVTHDSPFFDQAYLPEADLLRAQGLFLMCKFQDASKRIDGFVNDWTPVLQTLDTSLGSMDAAAAFADVRAHKAGETTRLPVSQLAPFAREDRFSDSDAFVTKADSDLVRISSLGGGALADWAKGATQARRDAVVGAAGQRVLNRAESARTELREMLSGIEITRLDLLNLEAQMYEKAAATGKLEYGDPIGRLRKLSKDRVGFRVWPFQGEYWMDELGWYRIDSRPDCPSDMAAGDR